MDKNRIGVGILLVLLVAAGAGCADLGKSAAESPAEGVLRIKIASIFVDDQEKALEFYTKVLGFTTKDDIPVGEFRWLTIVSPGAPEGMELLLEPNVLDAARSFQQALFEEGIPATTFFVDDIQAEFDRLSALGVVFTLKPTGAGSVTIAIFDDTCGNLIQLTEH